MTRRRFPTRRLAGLLLAVAVLGILLALDLRGQGAAWQLLWNITGEEEPAGQVRGLLEWAGDAFRPQPQTDRLTPIDHTYEQPYGINTFLHLEVEPEKREQALRMIADAGFGWIREQFPWEDIEIHGRGDFEDRRNVDAVGVVSAWAKYDNIVALAEQYGIQLQVRLDNPPEWSRANPDIGSLAPPDDVQDFVNYALAVATRYRGRVYYYQVWNEPNIYPEWGEQPVNPEAYTELLCRTYDALKAVDPAIVVISGALAPTIALDALAPGGRNLNDFIFLQRMYDAGAAQCFDILSVQGYGLNSGYTDQRMHPLHVNVGRPQYIRDIMVRNGDAQTPIWISEAAWNPVPSEAEVPEIDARMRFGQVTLEQAARYMPGYYQRAQEQWPWLGVINYWFFKRPADWERNQSFYYFRMVEPDFTPLPIYTSMHAYIHDQTPTLYMGVHQAEDWAITRSADAVGVNLDGAEFGTAVDTLTAEFVVYGTDVILRWVDDGSGIALLVNGDFRPLGAEPLPNSPGWRTVRVPLGLTAQPHTIRLAGFVRWQFDSVTVLNRTLENVFPYAGLAGIGMVMLVGVLVSALRRRLAV